MLALVRPDGSFLSISEARFLQWKADYQNVDVKAEIAKANIWLQKNPGRAWKTLAGFEKWLSRAQENAPKDKRQKLSETVSYRESKHYATEYEKTQKPPEDDGRRLDKSEVGRICRSLITNYEQRPSGFSHPSQLTCEHSFRPSFYGGGDWCWNCGMFRDQWRAV